MKRKLAIIASVFVFIVSGCGADTADVADTTAASEKSLSEEADENSTGFAPDADLTGFANLEKGDTPYTWFTRNYEYMNNNADAYMTNGPALLGVFEVGLDGNLITDYYGSYWWD